jgi:pyruvate formate lyase activating enzyme
LIADIKRHSLEDGPGIRSVVFFKGCPLRCSFCHNPEMQSATLELSFRRQRCVGCGQCVASCPHDAISLTSEERIDRDRCDLCGACVEACPSSALASVGQHHRVDDLVELLMRDEPYYRRSGGGVTLSGGECTMFPDFVEALVHKLKQQRLHVLVQTCGDFDGDWFVDRVLPMVDRVYFDVKLADPLLHRHYCGRDNLRILANLALLVRVARERVEIRVPLVPGITATQANMEAVARLLAGHGVRRATLLPYNPLGPRMAACLGRRPPELPERHMTRDELAAATAAFERAMMDAP